MRRTYVLAVLTVVFVGCAALAIALPPVPPDITMVSPDESLPDEVKLLSGKWVGKWDSAYPWDCVIYVEKVRRNSALITHSYGSFITSRRSCHCDPDYLRVHAANVSYVDGKSMIEFRANYRTEKHDVRNKLEANAGPFAKKIGSYVSLTLDKNNPDLLIGKMITGNGHVISTKLRRAD